MRSGARLRVITPNGEADVRPLQRAAAGSAPDVLPVLGQGHLSFFSRAQLRRLFEDVGFRVLRVRSIGVRRGLRALGAIPGSRGRARVMRRADLTPRTIPSAEARPAPERREEQAARIDAEVAAHHRRLRAWRPYFHYRRLAKRLDALPGAFAVGQDFDLLVEKR